MSPTVRKRKKNENNNPLILKRYIVASSKTERRVDEFGVCIPLKGKKLSITTHSAAKSLTAQPAGMENPLLVVVLEIKVVVKADKVDDVVSSELMIQGFYEPANPMSPDEIEGVVKIKDNFFEFTKSLYPLAIAHISDQLLSAGLPRPTMPYSIDITQWSEESAEDS